MKTPRPPIIVVLGHVDHGKTSLLDAIRKTNITAREAGGITQAIGASVVTLEGGKQITFIDTPGHAAFSNMRRYGAKVADIALLIVAADDGVQPQTLESIKFIKEADIPFIVVVTKIDLKTALPEQAFGQLEKEGVLLEKRGGDTPWIAVSAKTGAGIKELLDLIVLLAEVDGVSGDPEGELEAVAIETAKDKAGQTANVVVRNGRISVGDTIYGNNGECKVRNLFSDHGPVKVVFPGEPVKILGFDSLPNVGSGLHSFEVEKKNEVAGHENTKIGKDEIGIFVKTQNAGSLEALLTNLPPKTVVVDSGVGDVFESDVLNAKAAGVRAIYLFEAKASAAIKKLADAEGVKIKEFKIIYELIQDLEEVLKAGQVEILGKAEVIAKFPFDSKQVAGCRVVQGRIIKTDNLILKRGEKELGKIRALSLKKAKVEIPVVKQSEEFGLLFTPQFDFAVGDVILAVK